MQIVRLPVQKEALPGIHVEVAQPQGLGEGIHNGPLVPQLDVDSASEG